MQPVIFFSARRHDNPAIAATLRQRLLQRYGLEQVFSDYDTLFPSEHWAHSRKKAVLRCDAFVLLVGPHWEDLAHTDDPIREQLSWAQAAQKWIVPVTFDGGQVPPSLGAAPALSLDKALDAGIQHVLGHLDARLLDLILETTPPPRTDRQVVALRVELAPEQCDTDALIATLTRYLALGNDEIELASVRDGLVLGLRVPTDAASQLRRVIQDYPDVLAGYGAVSLADDDPLLELDATPGTEAAILSGWERYLQAARRQLRKGQYDLARRDYALARAGADDANELFDDGGFARELQRASARAAQAAQQGLAVLLDDTSETDLNLRHAQDWLDAWADALPDEQDAEYLRYRAEVRAIAARRQSDAYYRSARQRVEALWDDARVAGNEGARSEELLELMRRARDIARTAAANHPKDARFQQLLSEAEARRQRIAEEQDKMLSGAQGHQFELTLAHILATPDDETVPVYNENAVLQGRYPPRAALGIVVPQARTFANRKVNEYITQATRDLQLGQPRAAASTLGDIRKFAELAALVERADQQPLLYSDTALVLQEVQSDIAQAERLLDEAEERANAAVAMTERDAFGAWDTYIGAQERYAPGVPHSFIFKEAREQLQQALGTTLDEQLDDLTERLAVTDPATYYRDQWLQRLLDEAQTLRARAATIDLPLRDRLNRLDEIIRLVEEKLRLMGDVEQTLSTVAQNFERDPQGSSAALEELAYRVDTPLLEGHPRYDALLGAVNLRVSATVELERLQALLANPDPARVEGARRDAETAAAADTPYQADFQQLAARLAATHALLRADAVARREGYDSALASLAVHLTEELELLDQSLHARLSAKQTSLEREANAINTDRQRVQLARERHEAGNHAAAYKALRGVAHFKTAAERQHFHSLRLEVENTLAQAIMRHVDALTLDDPLDARLRQHVALLPALVPQQAEPYRQRFVVLEAVQHARQLAQTNQYREAIVELESILPEVSGAEWTRVNAQLQRYQQHLLAGEQSAIAQAVRTSQPDTPERREAMTGLLALLSRLDDLVAAADDPWAQLAYRQWQVELTMLRAEAVPDFGTRRVVFDQAEQFGQALDQAAHALSEGTLTQAQLAQVSAATHLARVGQHCPNLTGAIRAVETNLRADADFGLFTDAVAQFEDALHGYEPHFVMLLNWYDDRIQQVQRDLRLGIATYAEADPGLRITPEQLPYHARLLVLDPHDGQGQEMLTELPRLLQQLVHAVTTLEQRIYAQDGYAPFGGPGLLDEHIAQVSRTLDQVALVRDLLVRFGDEDALRGQSNRLFGTANRVNERLLQMNDELRRLKDELERFDAHIGAVDLVDDEDEQWRTAATQIDAIWLVLEDNVRGINQAFLRHPALKRAARTREEQRKRTQLLVGRLHDVQAAVAEEDYARAAALMSSLDDNTRAFFRRTSLYQTFTVQDVWYRSSIAGWRTVSGFVNERAVWQHRVEAWAADFAVPEAVLTGDATATVTAGNDNVVAWDAERERIEAQYAQRGDFDGAVAAIRCAIEGCEQQTRIGLRPALAQASQAPLVMNDEGKTGPLGAAEQNAGSRRSRRIIAWVKNERVPPYQAALQAAEAYHAEIAARSQAWERAELALVEAVKRLSNRIGERGFFGRLKDSAALDAAVHEYEAALLRMESIAPQHPRLALYRQDPDYQAALRIVG